MDVYRALNADIPQLLFTVIQQSAPTVSEDEYTRTITALHMEIRDQVQVGGQELHQWLQRQYSEQAEETVRKLQRHAFLSENANKEQVQEILERDFSRLSRRMGSESILGLQGSAVEVFNGESYLDPDLARRVADGHDYLTSIGFRPGQGILCESWLQFSGSLHYDLMEHMVRDRMGQEDFLGSLNNVSFGTWNLVYQLGESLTSGLSSEAETQEVTFAFDKDSQQYSLFRQEVSAMMEQVAEQVDLKHASFWQRRLGLGTSKQFVLRMRLATGEAPLLEVIGVIASAGYVGKETILRQGKLLLGKRIL